MTLKEARVFMLNNLGAKIACRYFHDEWIMFDGCRFVFEDGVEPDAWWWANAKDFDCEWYVIEEETK